MINRHVNYISDIKLKSTIELFEVDPQMKFICVNVPQRLCIYVIDLNQFSQQLNVNLLHYAKTKIYTSKLAVDALTKIDTSKDKSRSGVLLIRVSQKWQNRQFLAYGTIQHIHIYEIFYNKDKITFKPLQMLLVQKQSPVSAIRFHYSALYLGYHNDDMKIYEIDKKRNLWFQSDSLYKMTDQFLRIFIYDDDNGPGNQKQKENKKTKIKKVKISRKKSQMQQKQDKQLAQLKQRHPKFCRMQSIDQIMANNGLQYEEQPQKIDQQPHAPTIIYQKNNNSLWMAEYDHNDQDYVHIELCPPVLYKQGPVVQDSFWQQEQFDLGQNQGNTKTPGKSNKKSQGKSLKKKTTSKKSQRKTQDMQEKATRNTKSSNKNDFFQQDEFKPQQQQEIIISDPYMYKLTYCQNYIVQDTQQFYRILSRQADWNEIYEDLRQPFINSFFDKIQKRVFLEMLYRTGNQFCTDLMRYLGKNYEFVLVGFPTMKLYGNDLQPVELSVLKVQLLVVDKIGALEEKDQKALRIDVIKGMMVMQQYFNMNETEINEVYDQEMVQEIKKRMQKMQVNDKSKNPTYKSNRKSGKKMSVNQNTSMKKKNQQSNKKTNTIQKTPGSKREQHQTQQQQFIGRQNLRIRTPKQKSPYCQKDQPKNKSKNKSNNKTNLRSNKKKEQDKVEQFAQQQVDKLLPEIQPMPQINQYPHTYTFPIIQFEYFKSQPQRMQWIGENEIVFTSQQRRLNYFAIHPNILYSLIYKIYIYLYWIQFRDDLDPYVVQSFRKAICNHIQKENKMEVEVEDRGEKKSEQKREGSQDSQNNSEDGQSQYSHDDGVIEI